MKHITVDSFKEVLSAETQNSTVDFINVCTPAEYAERHIPGVRSVPLDEFEKHRDEFKDKKTIYIHCRSGKRGEKAIEKLQALGVTAELVNVTGGIMAWQEAGYETGKHTTRLPLMRQVFIAAGVLILLSHVLAALVAHQFVYLSVLVGAGLMISGITGWCGMALLLARAPWNRV